MNDAAANLARFNSYLTQGRDLAQSFADTMVQGFMNGQKASQVLLSALRSMESQLLQMVSKGLINAMFSSIGGMFGGTSGPSFLGGGNWLLPKANGDAFLGGRVTAFALGGVVGGPTLFPMANGMGLMGEAGPEAVMPLSRDPSGRLGVRAAGHAGGTQVNVTVNNNHSSAAVDVQQNKRPDGGVDLIFAVKEIVNQHIASGGADAPLRVRFGQQIRPRSR